MKILVVDDDHRIVKTTCDILKIKGHEPIAAYSGGEGVAKVRTDAPDCVLMTSYRQEMKGSIEQARKIGAYTCLYKPFEMDDLFRLIDEIRVGKLKNLLAAQ